MYRCLAIRCQRDLTSSLSPCALHSRCLASTPRWVLVALPLDMATNRPSPSPPELTPPCGFEREEAVRLTDGDEDFAFRLPVLWSGLPVQRFMKRIAYRYKQTWASPESDG